MDKKNIITPKRFIVMTLPIIGAILIAVTAILYIVYRSWYNQRHEAKWGGYDECGYECGNVN
ncbi:MAG: hypothetical protein K2H19_05410 [Ruminococcus sp.]|nr:hypothetical protein [Ruminococcus sp.]